MNNIRKRITALFLMVATVFAVVTPIAASAAPVRPAAVATTATDCSQSAFLGSRVCFDKSTAFGPVVLIYSNATNVVYSFGVSNAPGLIQASTGTEYEQATNAPWVYWSGIPYGGSTIALGWNHQGLNDPSNVAVTQAQWDQLSWYSNAAGYEFVVTA